MMTKIGILVIGTGKYFSFFETLKTSADRFLLANNKYKKTFFLFTDSSSNVTGAVKLYKEHKAFPFPTLTRYKTFDKYHSQLSKMDYLFYCDVDMKFVRPVSAEILSEMTGVAHPGYFDKPSKKYPYEKNKKSTAYIGPNEGRHYFCGGFNGGKSSNFLKMSKVISKKIDADLKNGIIAKFHDESHLNRYFIDHPPYKILDPSYCYPEGETLPFEPRLVALNKNHALERFTGLQMVVNSIKDKSFHYFIHKPIVALKNLKQK